MERKGVQNTMNKSPPDNLQTLKNGIHMDNTQKHDVKQNASSSVRFRNFAKSAATKLPKFFSSSSKGPPNSNLTHSNKENMERKPVEGVNSILSQSINKSVESNKQSSFLPTRSTTLSSNTSNRSSPHSGVTPSMRKEQIQMNREDTVGGTKRVLKKSLIPSPIRAVPYTVMNQQIERKENESIEINGNQMKQANIDGMEARIARLSIVSDSDIIGKDATTPKRLSIGRKSVEQNKKLSPLALSASYGTSRTTPTIRKQPPSNTSSITKHNRTMQHSQTNSTANRTTPPRSNTVTTYRNTSTPRNPTTVSSSVDADTSTASVMTNASSVFRGFGNGDPGRDYSVKDFAISRELGRGQFGSVYYARDNKVGRIVALKVLQMSQLQKFGVAKQMRREIDIQFQLQHKFILRLYGYFREGPRVFLVLEHASNGNLYQKLQKQKRFTEKVTARYMWQLCDALSYCHARDVIHRDIKPENALIDQHDNIKLCDFGWSVKSLSTDRRETVCGTLDYLPPEIVEKRTYDKKVDNWAVGVLTYECLMGRAPFEVPSQELTLTKITRARVEYPVMSYPSPPARRFIGSLIQKDPKNRMEMEEAISHDWIRFLLPAALLNCSPQKTHI